MSHIATTTSQSAVQSAVQAALLQDPRAGQLSPIELSAMIHALSTQVQLHGISAQQVVSNIHYATSTQPGGNDGTQDVCATNASFLCFVSPGVALVASLGLCALVIAILIAAIRLHRS